VHIIVCIVCLSSTQYFDYLFFAMVKTSLGTKKALHILNHKRVRNVIYFKNHFAVKSTKAPLKGLRAMLKRHILPLVKEKGAYTGKALRDRCVHRMCTNVN